MGKVMLAEINIPKKHKAYNYKTHTRQKVYIYRLYKVVIDSTLNPVYMHAIRFSILPMKTIWFIPIAPHVIKS